jgi:uncharacterized protein (DUF58 family)
VAGAPGDEHPPPDSLEWLIEGAASIGSALGRRGATLRVVTDSGELAPPRGRGGLGPSELLDALALIRPSKVSGLAAGVELVSRAAGDGPVICLLGAVGAEEVAELVQARSGPVTDLAVLADIGSWADAGLLRGRRSPSATARAELARQRDDAAALLRAAGWHVAVARADSTVADVWGELAGPVGVPA